MKPKQSVPPLPLSRKMCVRGQAEGLFLPRVTHRAGRKRGRKEVSPSFRIRCGCCPEGPIEIYYDVLDEPRFASLEISGVSGGVLDWRDILLPLLGFERKGKAWADKLPQS